MLKRYICGFCETCPDQISHHKSHLQTQKHGDKKKIFELSLFKYTEMELKEKYGTSKNELIIENIETILVYDEKKMNSLDTISCNSDKEMSVKQEQIKQSNSVSNKEALKNKIHEIHNYLRNNGAGYGMTSLKIFNILYGLKKIEDTNSFELQDDCKFSHLLTLAEENKEEYLSEYIYKNVLDYIHDNEKLDKLIFYEIPRHIKSSVFSHLVKEINKIPIIEKASNVLLSGKIYEYFVGRDQTAISELGAYFTDRHIVDFIYSRVNPEIKEDGTIHSMIDMFGGSGGFTTGYINNLIKKYPDINWKTELDKIYHFDMNNDVIKSAALEFFCLTGVIPNMENNIRCINSFKDTFADKKFFYPITNPPYGGDKRETSQEAEKRKKIKEYIKEELKDITDEATIHRRQLQLKETEKLDKIEKKEFDKQKVCLDTCNYSGQRSRINCFAHKYKLKGNDKESCSLILLMDMVELGGTAVGVLKEGVFFNKTYKELRRVLVKNFNLREVISIPSDQFENTTTKTSIVIFDNKGEDETTSQVIFSELSIKKFDKDVFAEILGEIIIVENKDDIKGVVDKVISIATREDILNNPICSLNGKDYNKQEIVCGEEYELVKLGNYELKNGKQLDKKNINTGIYPVYSGGLNPIGFHNEYNRENCTFIAGTGKCGYVQFDKDKFWASQCFTIKSINLLENKYLFFICKVLEPYFMKCGGGSVQKFIRAKHFIDLKIPIPKTSEKLKYWVDKISKPYDEKIGKFKEIQELEKKVQDRIKEIIETEDCDEKELGEICSFNTDNYSSKDDFKEIFYLELGNISDTKIQDLNKLIIGKDKIPSRCKRKVKVADILIGTVRPNLKRHCYIHKNVWKNNLLVSTGFCVISVNVNINPYYLFTLLTKFNYFTYKLTKSASGSSYPSIDTEDIKVLKIPIPTNPELIQEMEPDFQKIEKLQGEVKEAEELYQQYIKELAEEVIPPELNVKQEVILENDNSSVLSLDEKDELEIKDQIESKDELEIKDQIEPKEEEGDELETQLHSSSSIKVEQKVKVPSNKKQCKGCNKIFTTKTLKLYDGEHCKTCYNKL